MRRRYLVVLGIALSMPGLVTAQYNALSLTGSPTKAITSNFFTEAADQYMDPLSFDQVKSPVFLLKLKTGTAIPVTAVNDPYEIGMGSWFGKVYGGAYYGFDASNTGLIVSGSDMLSVSQDEKDTLILSADGKTQLGKTAVVTEQVNYQNYSMNNPSILVGFSVGPAQLGIKDTLYVRGNRLYGSYNTAGALQSSTTTKIMDTAGLVSFLDSTEYAVGEKANSSVFSNDFSAGLVLPLGAVKLRGSFGLAISGTDTSTSYGVEKRKVQTGAGYASYTPTLALPGNTAAAIADAQFWSIDLADTVAKPTEIAPEITVALEIPVKFAGNAATLGAGLGYNLTLTSRTADLEDEAGAALKVSGVGGYSHRVDYTNLENTTTHFMETTTYASRMYWSNAYTASSVSEVSLPLSFKVEPNAGFRFGVGLTPVLTFGSIAYSAAGKRLETTTFDDGNGITDGSDYSTVVSTVDQPYAVTTTSLGLAISLGSGVQIYVKPDKFRINLGAQATSKLIDRTETRTGYTGLATATTTTTDGMGVATVTSATASTVSSGGGSEFTDAIVEASAVTSVWYVAGFTYFVNPNVMFDFYAKNARAFNLSSTTDNGGFLNLNNYTIQLTIKLPPNGPGLSPAPKKEGK